MTDEEYKPIDVGFDMKLSRIKNFGIEVRDSAPETAVQGALYYDSNNDVIMYYDGSKWIEQASLDDDRKLPTSFLYTVKSDEDIGLAGTDDNIPTALLVKRELDKKMDDIQLVTEWSDPVSDENVPSEKLTKDTLDSNFETLDNKIDSTKSELEQEIQTLDEKVDDNYETLDNKIDSNYNTLNTKIDTVKTDIEEEISDLDAEIQAKLDLKLDDSQLVQEITENTQDIPSSYAIRLALDTKLNVSQVEQELTTQSDMVPSSHAVSQALEGKIDDSQLIQEITESTVDIPSSKAIYDALGNKVDQSSVTQEVTMSVSEVPSGYATTMALNKKTDITMAIGVWQAGLTYNEYSTVVYSGKILVSLQDNNYNHDPAEDTEGEWWQEISGSGGSGTVNGKTIQFGNSVDTEYELTHNLSTYDFLYSLRTNDESREYVNARVQAMSYSKVKVILSNPPGLNALTINMIALRSQKNPIQIEEIDVTEEARQWTFDNTSGSAVFIQTFDDDGNEVIGDIVQDGRDSFTPVQITFGSERTGKIVVVKTPCTYYFENQSTWIVSHNQATYMAVQCYNDDTGQMMADVRQDGNVVVISWASQKTGYAVLAPPTYNVECSGDVWTVAHNLNRMVAVQTYDSEGDQIYGDVVQDGNSVTVTFGSSKTGFMLIV